jgi:predicted MFS family arabinose efflux permease
VIAPRHGVLGIYAAWNALMQFEWLRLAPVTDSAAAQYGVSESQIGLLSLLFPLLFLPLALPSGRLIDRLSLRSLLRLVAISMTVAAALRIISPGFTALLAGQVLFAVVQPLVVSLISKLAMVWYPESERLSATSVGTIALLLGTGLAMAVVPRIEMIPIARSLLGDVALMLALSLATFLLVPDDPESAFAGTASRWLEEIAGLIRDRGYWLLLSLVFIGNGYASAVFTWLEPMLKPQGISAQDASLIGLLILGGGILGMAVAPQIPRIYERLRPLFFTLIPLGAALTLLLIAHLPFLGLCVVAALLGVCVQGPLPLIVELVTETAGAERAGTAASGFWMAANAGAAALIASLSGLADSGRWTLGVGTLAGSLLVQAVLAQAYVRYRERCVRPQRSDFG